MNLWYFIDISVEDDKWNELNKNVAYIFRWMLES